jgi:hypothetical protein
LPLLLFTKADVEPKPAATAAVTAEVSVAEITSGWWPRSSSRERDKALEGPMT